MSSATDVAPSAALLKSVSDNLSGYSFKVATSMDEIDAGGVGGAKQILIYSASNHLYVSFDNGWIRYQYAILGSSPTSLKHRVIYGQSIGNWNSFALTNDLAPTSMEILATYEYGTLKGCYWPSLKLAFVKWNGNANASPSGTIDVTPSESYRAFESTITTMRNGNVMEARSEGKIRLIFTGSTWSGASLTYRTV